jgi:anti-sigma-K factor RskA
VAANDDHIALAGEYVLGTLSAEERLEAQNLIGRDRNFADAVSDWERILVVVSLTVRAVTPPAALRKRVLKAIARSEAKGGDVVSLKRNLNVWRGLTVAATAVAAALAAFIVLRPMLIPPPAGNYVAVLQPEGPGPAFVASIDIGRSSISVKRVGAEAQTDKSYELWAVGGGRDKPQSLGVIDASLKVPAQKLGTGDPSLLDQTVFAISLEQKGGSPTGQPTQVLYTGKLIPPPSATYLAVLQPEGPGPAFVASIDIDAGTISIRRVGAEEQPNNSYELWAVGGGRDKPQSLGVIDASLNIPASQLGKVDPVTLDQTVFAISLEPKGGSPSGAPTQVLYTGKLVATE